MRPVQLYNYKQKKKIETIKNWNVNRTVSISPTQFIDSSVLVHFKLNPSFQNIIISYEND